MVSKLKRSLPPIPDLPTSVDPAIRSAFTALKEALEVRLGRRGDPLEQAVTKREMVEAGLAKLTSPLGQELAPIVTEHQDARIVPPTPRGLVAVGVFGGVTLTWENPFEAYNVHSLAEIWRGETNNPNDRLLIGSTRGATYFDRHGDDEPKQYWYWVRFISEYNREGPFSTAVTAAKLDDLEVIMDHIGGRIDESMLSDAFRAEYTGAVRTLAEHERKLVAHDSKITQQALITEGLSAQYTLRLDVNGYISGIGAYNDGRSAEFAIIADRFWLAPPNSTGKIKPFVYEQGKIYMDTVLIRDGSIQQGKLGPISFGKIVDNAGRPVTTVAGKLRADAIDVTNLQVTDANIAGVLRSNQVGRNGQPRWMLDKNGGLSMNGGGASGGLEIRDGAIKVFDANNRVRVQIGDMQA